MTQLNTADRLYFGALPVKAAWLGGLKQVWTLPVPVNTVAPAVTGGTTIGSTLTCSTGTWTNTPTSYAYQWQVDDGGWTDLTGETASTLDTTGFDPGSVRCLVTATNAYGDGAPAASNTVVLTGGTTLIFGHDTRTSGSGFPASEDRALVTQFVKSAGAVTKVFARFYEYVAGNAKVFALSDASGAPGSLLWITPSHAADGVIEFTLPGDVSGTDAAGTYWLGVVADNYDFRFETDDSTGDESHASYGSFSFTSPPSTWPGSDGTYGDTALCVWCEYTG